MPLRKLFNLIPTPAPFSEQSRADQLKERLDWGEPALTIVDARNRSDYQKIHITGAVPMPMPESLTLATQTLESDRDIYIYAATDDETAEVARQLRQAGFQRVSELRGGVAAWQAFGYPVDANVAEGSV
ncbi:MAG: rhodanese-like domain-containing protein [Spirulinaceae cyanobacterium RM2_2_10]|nr:rhodanese-like domain-containing protein [Spirulinaceae cyanobacterium SM2_1_0]NJO20565.1 rhodanese-like domain-containing protein [Spirulinaceae cyanobacterium RM2_2_10]